METFNDNSHQWSSFLGGEPIDECLGAWDPENPLDNYDFTEWIDDDPVSHIAAAPQTPVLNSNFPDPLLGFLEGPIHYGMPMAVLPDLSPMMSITSPSSSGDALSTSAFAELGSISSPTMSEPGLSPFSPMGQSPLAWWDLLQSLITNTTPGPFAAQPDTSAYIGGAAIFKEPTPPGVNVHQPSSQIAVATRELTMEDKPPGMPAREWRNKIKPEQCPECPMSFPFPCERNRHIADLHRNVAGKHGVLWKSHVCEHCSRAYKRKDHLARHMTKRHGRVPKKKRHRK